MDEMKPFPSGGAPRLGHLQGTHFNEGQYFDNYYTRLLTGACGACGFGDGGKANKTKLKGCSVHTQRYPFLPVTERQFHRAVAVLDRFDLVLIMENFHSAAMHAWLTQRLMNLFGIHDKHTLDGLRLGHSRTNTRVAKSSAPSRSASSAVPRAQAVRRATGGSAQHGHGSGGSGSVSAVPDHRGRPPPEIADRLMAENAFDVRLYSRVHAQQTEILAAFSVR